MKSLLPALHSFCNPLIDRYAVILSMLDEAEIPHITYLHEGKRHIIVSNRTSDPDREQGIILAAHHDRVRGSPGANDNGAAVFQLLKAALLLQKVNKPWLIVWTDKEELLPGESLKDQGSYGLAKRLIRKGMGYWPVFIFDATGIGDTLLISTMGDFLNSGLDLAPLRAKVMDTARAIGLPYILAPSPFSDDGGFLTAGMKAQTITLLPAAEATELKRRIDNEPGFANLLVAQKTELRRRLLPQTWRGMNSPNDSYGKLTPKIFNKMKELAVELVGTR
ncbi:MAG: M28 family peptidase [Spirochaetaceae bacterium]|jgi:hypothetical protein|nr:M28 family peptidase [Spirochaetaceae bacterium]